MDEGIDDSRGCYGLCLFSVPTQGKEMESPWDGECRQFLIPCTAGSGGEPPKVPAQGGNPLNGAARRDVLCCSKGKERKRAWSGVRSGSWGKGRQGVSGWWPKPDFRRSNVCPGEDCFVSLLVKGSPQVLQVKTHLFSEWSQPPSPC